MQDLGPRNVFVYLLNFLTLYLSAIGAALLTWGLADHWFEDPLDFYAGSGPIRSGIAMLVVAFPLFLYMNRLIGRPAGAGRASEPSMVKKVLTYITLFLLAITTIIDLIAVIYVFLGGDLTARFAVRGGGILMIVGFVYAYYLSDLKDPAEPSAEVADPPAEVAEPPAAVAGPAPAVDEVED